MVVMALRGGIFIFFLISLIHPGSDNLSAQIKPMFLNSIFQLQGLWLGQVSSKWCDREAHCIIVIKPASYHTNFIELEKIESCTYYGEESGRSSWDKATSKRVGANFFNNNNTNGLYESNSFMLFTRPLMPNSPPHKSLFFSTRWI